MQVKLSPRLAAIANYIPDGSIVADIGTDHAYLPVYLMTHNISPRIIATDIHEKPLNSAIELIEMLNLSRKIETRLGDGLRVLEPGEADVLVIAGMGSGTMIHILREAPEVLADVKRLVLQPMRGPSKLRKWLIENEFKIVDECLVEDDGIIYEILVAEHGNQKLSDEEILIGPMLLKNKPPLLKKYLEQKLLRTEDIVKEMENSTSHEVSEKKAVYINRLETLRKVIACL